MSSLLHPAAFAAMVALRALLGQGEDVLTLVEDRPVAYLVVGLLAIALIVFGLVRRIVKLVVVAVVVAAIAWYFYFSPPG